MAAETRSFEDKPAKRERVPLLMGIVGPSGSGKTYSMLRTLTGFQRVVGGDIYVIDTEARRALHYADRFNFRHVQLDPPHDPLSYLAAFEHCVKKGAKVIGVDSMSHEHEGIGGVLDMADQELDRLVSQWEARYDKKATWKDIERFNASKWIRPKHDRNRLTQGVVATGGNFVFCFRAQEKLDWKKKGAPEDLGFQPIMGGAFVYELTLRALLLPNSNGVPEWNPSIEGERNVRKLPEQFAKLFASKPQLSEDLGEAMARWAAGGAAGGAAPAATSTPATGAPSGEAWPDPADVAALPTLDALRALSGRLRAARDARSIPPEQFRALTEAAKLRHAELTEREQADKALGDERPDFS